MPDATAQLRRILQLVPQLGRRGAHSLAEIADRMGVDRDVLVSDIRDISERFDVPGGFIEGLTIYLEADQVEVRTGHFLRPMRLTRPELLALELGLAMLQAERPPEERPAIERARRRLAEVIAGTPDHDERLSVRLARLRRRSRAFAPAAHANRARRRVRLTYRKVGRGPGVEPGALPLRHRVRQRHVVHRRQLRRRGAPVLPARPGRGRRGARPALRAAADFSLDEVVRDGRAFQAPDAGSLRVRYSPRVARWIAEREGKTVEADGSLTMDHPLADTDWAVRHVLQYGPDAEVLEPAAVREEIVRRLTAIAT